MSCLLVIKGPNLGVRYDLGERTRIGRLGENEIQVADPNVSRVHAEIVKERMAYTIYDRGSKNGLLVNGEEVTEKVLLRNDEVVIGNTVFLFNSDLNIQNARYSDNSVYIYPSENETLDHVQRHSGLEKLTGRERESIDFVLRFADLFAAPPAPLVETAQRLMQQVTSLLNADSSILLLNDNMTDELRPVLALPAQHPVGTSRQLLGLVVEEKQAILISEKAMLPPMLDSEDREVNYGSFEKPVLRETSRTIDSSIQLEVAANTNPPVGPTSPTDLTTMVAPMFDGEHMVGAIVVQKAELDFYTLRDLGLLQAVAKLATGTIESSRLLEREASLTAQSSGEEDEQGSGLTATRSLRMQEILNAARRSAESDVTVLISGETGTGKELLARYIHRNSPRHKGPFVAINCGAIPANLFESELFGYEKGAFTGANRTTPGKIESAQGGTLFLDEIGELDVALQPKLLRFLQDRAFYRVGGTRAIDANVRIIAATNMDLAAAVRSGSFREDLWYRLNVVPFHLPPLRERREDIGHLVDHLVARFSQKLGRKVLGANDGALALLQKYDWPGNIRELENAVERAVLLAEGKILTTSDFAHIEEARRRAMQQADLERKRETRPLTEVERQHIIVALKKFNYNQARAAEALGLHRNTLRNKIIEYGIDIPK